MMQFVCPPIRSKGVLWDPDHEELQRFEQIRGPHDHCVPVGNGSAGESTINGSPREERETWDILEEGIRGREIKYLWRDDSHLVLWKLLPFCEFGATSLRGQDLVKEGRDESGTMSAAGGSGLPLQCAKTDKGNPVAAPLLVGQKTRHMLTAILHITMVCSARAKGI